MRCCCYACGAEVELTMTHSCSSRILHSVFLRISICIGEEIVNGIECLWPLRFLFIMPGQEGFFVVDKSFSCCL